MNIFYTRMFLKLGLGFSPVLGLHPVDESVMPKYGVSPY